MGYHVAVCCVVVGWGFLDPEREIVYNVGYTKGDANDSK